MNWSADYLEKEAPAGYEFTGEVRAARAGDIVLNAQASRSIAFHIHGSGVGVRRILRKIETPRFVNVTTSRTIWVTLPGDNAGHKLTEDEARALFRQLEEVV